MDKVVINSGITQLLKLGVPRPKTFDAIEAAFKSAVDSTTQREQALADLKSAIMAGDIPNAARCRDKAVRAATAATDSDLRAVAERARADGLLQALDPVKAHAHIAKRYNATVAAFTADLELAGDADAEPSVFLKMRRHEAGEAWTRIPDHVAELRRLEDGLITAARLAGVIVAPKDLRSVLPLIATADEDVRTAVILAHDPQRDRNTGATIPHGRGGRYTAMLAAGATLKASPLDQYARWEEAAPAPRPRPSANAALARAMR